MKTVFWPLFSITISKQQNLAPPKFFEKKEAGSTQKEISTKKVAETPSFVQDR